MFAMSAERMARPGETPARVSARRSSTLSLTLLPLALGSLLLPTRGAIAG
jgi:hypothetical protein